MQYILWFWIIIMTCMMLAINENILEEGFTPKIRGYYRPHIRNTRLYIESFTNKYSSDYFINMLRKIGIY